MTAVHRKLRIIIHSNARGVLLDYQALEACPLWSRGESLPEIRAQNTQLALSFLGVASAKKFIVDARDDAKSFTSFTGKMKDLFPDDLTLLSVFVDADSNDGRYVPMEACVKAGALGWTVKELPKPVQHNIAKYGGYSIDELNTMVSISESSQTSFDMLCGGDDASSCKIIKDLLLALKKSEHDAFMLRGARDVASGAWR